MLLHLATASRSGASITGRQLIAGDSFRDNLAMSPHTERRKWAPITLIKQWKEKGGTGEGDNLSGVPMLETCMFEVENADHVKLYEHLVAQEHVESCHVCRSKRH